MGGAIAHACAGLVIAAAMMSCVSVSKKSAAPVDYARRIQRLEKQLKKKNSVIDDLKERNLVLEHRSASKSLKVPENKLVTYSENQTPILPETENQAATVTETAKATEPVPVPVPALPIPAGENAEHFLYSKIIDTYRSHNQGEMKTTLRLLLKTYPDSIFADNALYMAGLLSYELGDLNGAKASFGRVIKEYPQSNKVVSALFMTATIDKKKGRPGDAIRGFKLVRDLFPGSPEAFRVSVELKLLGQPTSKLRES